MSEPDKNVKPPEGEQPPAPDSPPPPTTPQEQTPAISAAAPEAPAPDTAPPKETLTRKFNSRRTKLHEILHELWGISWISEDEDEFLSTYIKSAKKTDTGFEIQTATGAVIRWETQTDAQGNAREIIHSPTGAEKAKFTQADATAMIVLARLRGWKSMDVHGTDEQKEMLWLAVQHQNMRDRIAFDVAQNEGKIPKEQDGKPVVFTPSVVSNFAPSPNSPLFKKWQAEEQEFNKLYEQAMAGQREPAVTESAPKKAAPTPAAPKTP